ERKTSADLQLQLGTLSDQLTDAKSALAKSKQGLARANANLAAALAAADRQKQASAKTEEVLQAQIAAADTKRKEAESLTADKQAALDQLALQMAALQKQLQEIQAA